MTKRLMQREGCKPNTTQMLNAQEREEVFSEIIEDFLVTRNISKTLKTNKHRFPNAVAFFKWVRDNPQYKEIYTFARESNAQVMFDEMNAIAKGGSDDSIVKIQRDRLRVDTMKFYLAKVLPRMYGEKIDVTSNGEAINVISLGTGIAPPSHEETDYIDVTEGVEMIG